MRAKAWLIIVIGLVAGDRALASYRVHHLRLTEYDRRGRLLLTREILSTLDHLQWEHVNAGYRTTKVELVDTWYCPGDTSRRGYCSKPTGVKTRGPASTLDKRGEIPFNRQPVIP